MKRDKDFLTNGGIKQKSIGLGLCSKKLTTIGGYRMKTFKKVSSIILILIMVLSIVGCGKTSNNTENPDKGTDNDKGTVNAEPIELTVWSVNEIHSEMWRFGEEAYNKKNPEAPIKVNVEILPNAEMHNKLLMALQTGTGAPDVADINLNFYTNFTSKNIQLAPLDDVVERAYSEGNYEKSRFDLYKVKDSIYALPTHVGATVTYYNMDIIEQAGFTISDVDAIETWDQYNEMGKTVLEKTGVPMTCFEVSNQRPFWPMIVQHGGDYLTKDNEVILDSQNNIEVLDYMLGMYKSGVAIQAGGGATSTEEFYSFMNEGSVASLTMPSWYMSRFLNYMPNLEGKIAIRPMPVFVKGEPRTVGIGGTGTAITNQCKNIDVAKEFLYEAKLSYDSNVNIWSKLAFDPVNLDTWKDPELLKASDYFYGESFFEIMAPYISDCLSPANADLSVAAQDLVNNTIMYSVFVDQSRTPEEALKSAAEELRAQQ